MTLNALLFVSMCRDDVSVSLTDFMTLNNLAKCFLNISTEFKPYFKGNAMHSSLPFKALPSVIKGIWFAFFTVPARTLFLLLLFLFLSGSPAGKFIATARQLVGDAPPDQVWVCRTNVEQFTEDRPKNVLKKRPCIRVPVDAERFAADVDRSIILGWLYLGVLSLIVYFLRFTSDIYSLLQSALARMKFAFSRGSKS